MSDGVSDAYAAASEAEIFRKKWEKAQMEELLLTDLRLELKPLSTAELIHRAYQESRYLRLDEENGWLVKYQWGDHFQTSIAADEAHNWPTVIRYRVNIGGSFGEFRDYSQNEALIDAILYLRWLTTKEGIEAMEEYENG